MEICRLEIKAVPNASRSEIVGLLDGVLKVRIQAPPIEGRANLALCSFLSEVLGLHKRSVRLLKGDSSCRKIIEIEGMSFNTVMKRLGLG